MLDTGMSDTPFQKRAYTEPKFTLKYLVIGVLCFGFFLYSVYDGFYAYPAKLGPAAAWQELVEDDSLDDEQRRVKWKEVAEKNGWDTKRPKKGDTVEHIQWDIQIQYLFMGIGLLGAVPNLLWYFKVKGSWIECEGKELRHSDGTVIPFKDIQTVDKKKWVKKGIAVVNYKAGNEEKSFVIDDLTYQRQPTDEIMTFLESHLKRDQIINGPTEAEIQAEKDVLIQKEKAALGQPTEKLHADTLVDDSSDAADASKKESNV